MESLLTLLIAVPALGAVVTYVFGRKDFGGDDFARASALITSFITLAIALLVAAHFDTSSAEYQLVEKYPWFQGYAINYHVGVDGISLPLILLTVFLMPICILCSLKNITVRVRDFMALFLLLESLIIGVFCALDLLLFYLFFEGVLIPMYLIIGIWGGKERIYAAYKFFLYTLAGSVLMLLAVLYLYFVFGTTDIPKLMQQAPSLSLGVQQYLWVAMFLSFAVKVPMWPFHTWLPDAHVQAPTAGSVILAGILLKLGGYGFLRFSLPMLPDASHALADIVLVLSVIAVVYTSLVALMQNDMKKLIAYSSVAHMGLVTIGIFSFNQQAIEGAMIQMVSHGLVSGALFLCVGVLYDRLHTREITRYGGVTNIMPYFAATFMVFTMASVGLPGTSGFVGEILVIVGAYQAATWAAIGAATGLVLGAAYMLWLYARVMFGEVTHKDVATMSDLSVREILIFLPLVAAVLWLGIYPSSLTQVLTPSVLKLIEQANHTHPDAASPLAGEAPPVVTPVVPAPEVEAPPASAAAPAHNQAPAVSVPSDAPPSPDLDPDWSAEDDRNLPAALPAAPARAPASVLPPLSDGVRP
ncbi:MAG: NADH-quinone oxidoreductase subunit M [Alphaproteobacteria bacterium]